MEDCKHVGQNLGYGVGTVCMYCNKRMAPPVVYVRPCPLVTLVDCDDRCLECGFSPEDHGAKR